MEDICKCSFIPLKLIAVTHLGRFVFIVEKSWKIWSQKLKLKLNWLFTVIIILLFRFLINIVVSILGRVCVYEFLSLSIIYSLAIYLVWFLLFTIFTNVAQTTTNASTVKPLLFYAAYEFICCGLHNIVVLLYLGKQTAQRENNSYKFVVQPCKCCTMSLQCILQRRQ